MCMMPEIYLDEYEDFSDTRRKKIDPERDFINLTLVAYYHIEWFKKKTKNQLI